MFDNSPIHSERLSSDLTINQLRDGLSSITHRVAEIEALLSRKIDRSQCLGIVEKKVSHGQLRRGLEDLESRIREQKNQQASRNLKMQEIAIDKINQLGKKLKTSTLNKPQKQETKTAAKETHKRAIQPQELFLESNQTMFSLLIEEIYKLQSKDQEFQKQFELRNKKIIALNNEVCAKIDKLQAELDEKVKASWSMGDSKMAGNTWSHLENPNKATVHKCPSDGNKFEAFRFDMLSKSIETLQKQLLTKINIKDVLPIIKQNYEPLSSSIEEIRQYVEQSVESTRRILSSQTEINREISLGVKIAWWYSYQQEHQFAIINKEIINLVPEILELPKSTHPNFIKVNQQGLYIFKASPIGNTRAPTFDPTQEQEVDLEEDSLFEVMVGTDVHLCRQETALRLDKNCEVRVIERSERELVFSLQKL